MSAPEHFAYPSVDDVDLVNKTQPTPVESVLRYAFGGKEVIGVLFSASYCKYCHEFVPDLEKVYPQLLKHGVEVVLVSSDKTADSHDYYAMDQPWNFVCFDDPARQSIRKEYDILTIPALLFFDKQGNLIHREGRNLVKNALSCSGDDFAEAGEKIVSELGIFESSYDSDNSDF